MSTTLELLDVAEELAGRGQAREAVRRLSDANRKAPDPTIEKALVRMRRAAWAEVDRPDPNPDWDPRQPDQFESVAGIPEIDASEMDVATIRSAIQHHGGIVVRRLISDATSQRLRDAIDLSWEAIERFRETKQPDPAWYDPLDADECGLSIVARNYVLVGGTAYVPDSPRLLFELLEAFDAAGVKQVVTEYFGEPPALSLIKMAQRRLAPEATGGWHQDGAVYGTEARTLNVWVPVSPCGDVAPGLEMFPRRLDGVVETVGSGYTSFATTDQAVATLTAEVPPARPVFAPGDAAIFDQFLLHQTAASPTFEKPRYGFECWFFAPSTYPEPERWIPLVY